MMKSSTHHVSNKFGWNLYNNPLKHTTCIEGVWYEAYIWRISRKFNHDVSFLVKDFTKCTIHCWRHILWDLARHNCNHRQNNTLLQIHAFHTHLEAPMVPQYTLQSIPLSQQWPQQEHRLCDEDWSERTTAPNKMILTTIFDMVDLIFKGSELCKNAHDGHQWTTIWTKLILGGQPFSQIINLSHH